MIRETIVSCFFYCFFFSANEKLDSLSKSHHQEMAKLKAIMKKEEISRNGLQEQLEQKTRENTELVKICDELIGGSGSS